jgi:pimeloyl-ACP methyl ester carboxylesterase
MQWALVQAALEKRHVVVSYDRAGLGWSDSAPGPRTSRQMVEELHGLLTRAGIGGPFVLVGHSLGGLNARMFARMYPGEVVGIVLVAAGSEHDLAWMPPEYARIEQLNRETDRRLSFLERFGLLRILQRSALVGSFRDLVKAFPPEQQRQMMAMTVLRSSYWQTAYRELEAINDSRSQVAAAGSLGDLPLVVLSGSPDLSHLPPSFPIEKIRRTFEDLQENLLQLSTDSVQITCDSCDHYLPMTNPSLVVDAVNLLLHRLED